MKKSDAKRKNKDYEQPEQEKITEQLIELCRAGKIQSRTDILANLQQMGYELPRIGKDYITVLDVTTQKRMRLKGALYNSDFNVQSFLNQQEEHSISEKDKCNPDKAK